MKDGELKRSMDGAYVLVDVTKVPAGMKRSTYYTTGSFRNIDGALAECLIEVADQGLRMVGPKVPLSITAGLIGACVVTTRDWDTQVSADPYKMRDDTWGIRLRDPAVVSGRLLHGFPGVPSSKKVADWPLQCPKCGRRDAAVLLFSSYDCRFGCFKATRGLAL